MTDIILDIVDTSDLPKCEDWIRLFNQYRENNTFKDAVFLIWNDWNVQENVFFELLPNPEALIFSLLTYTPDRAKTALINAPATPIKWNDSPLYDSIYNDYYNIYVWNCADWKAWHVALENHYGSTTTANGIWESAWLHEDNECLALGLLCPDTSYCRYDCNFVEYFASKNVIIGNLLSNTYCDVSNVVLNLTEAAENASEGAKNTSKVISNILPLAAGAVAVVGGVKLYKAL